MSGPVEFRDGSGLRRCPDVMAGVEQHLPLQQDAGDPAQGPAIGVTPRP